MCGFKARYLDVGELNDDEYLKQYKDEGKIVNSKC
jgi:hypothetical protein